MEKKAAVLIWQWEFRGMLVAAPAARLCLYRTGGRKRGELILGAGLKNTGLLSPSWVLPRPGDLGKAERFALWILPFPVVLAGEGDVLWETSIRSPSGSSHPYSLRRASDGDFCL